MVDRPVRDLGREAAVRGRYVYTAGALALTEPGPAAAGVVVTDDRDRPLAQRAHYLGKATRAEASAQALLAGARVAMTGLIESPIFRSDDSALVTAMQQHNLPPDMAALTIDDLTAVLDELPGHHLELISPAMNPARATALAPLVEWLPERTRRAEGLEVTPAGEHRYEVASAGRPGHTYVVTLRPPGVAGVGNGVTCSCADFTHRGIPCKHLLAVAGRVGALDQVFYPHADRSTPPNAV